MKVFWSWQSDRSAKLCRNVIQGAIVRALQELSEELELEECERPEIDHDTKGEAGMAAIADTLFRKIEEAAVFVGDITSVARSEGGRELPNPNVLIELGWAWAKLSHKNIILVANRSFGPKKPEQLPFDIRHRRAVIFYDLERQANEDEIALAIESLAKNLKDALGFSLADWLASTGKNEGPAGRSARPGNPSVWFEQGAILRHQPFHGGGGLRSVRPREGRTLYVRIVPEQFPDGMTRSMQVHEWIEPKGSAGLTPFGPCASGDGGLNGEGVLRYALSSDENSTETATAVQWFRDTGELWSFDTIRLQGGTFNMASAILGAAMFITRGLKLLERFKASGLIRIEVGAFGLLDTQWSGQFNYERSDALQNVVQISQSRRRWDDVAIIQFLTEASVQFGAAYGRAGFNEGDIRRIVGDTI